MQQTLYLLIALMVMGFIITVIMGIRNRYVNRAMVMSAVANRGLAVPTIREIEMAKQEKIFEEVTSKSMDPIHEIILISNNLKEMLHHINPIFFLDLQKFHPNAFNQIQKFKDNCAYKDIIRNIRNGKEQGYYQKEVDEDFVARYRMAQLDMLMFGNYFAFDKISFTQAHQLLLDMFVYGICTLKGHQLINEYKGINEQE